MREIDHEIRERDGARKQCPQHPDSRLEQGYTGSGQLKTWCTEPGCSSLAQWVPVEGAADESSGGGRQAVAHKPDTAGFPVRVAEGEKQ